MEQENASKIPFFDKLKRYFADEESQNKLHFCFAYLIVFFFSFSNFFPRCYNFFDTGFFLTKYDELSYYGVFHTIISPYWWLSEVIGTICWQITEPFFGLEGLRLGEIIINMSLYLLTLKILFLVFQPRFLTGVVIAVVGLRAQSAQGIIDYLNVPILFLMFFSLFFIKLNLYPEKVRYQILSGVFFVLAILSRLPLVVFFIVFPICFFVVYRFKKDEIRQYLKAYLVVFGVIAIGLIMFLFFLYYQNLFNLFFSFSQVTAQHNLLSFLKFYKGDLNLFFYGFFIFGVSCLVYVFFRDKAYAKKIAIFSFWIIFGITSLCGLFFPQEGKMEHVLLVKILIFSMYFFLPSVIFLKFRRFEKARKIIAFSYLSLVGLLLMLLCFYAWKGFSLFPQYFCIRNLLVLNMSRPVLFLYSVYFLFLLNILLWWWLRKKLSFIETILCIISWLLPLMISLGSDHPLSKCSYGIWLMSGITSYFLLRVGQMLEMRKEAFLFIMTYTVFLGACGLVSYPFFGPNQATAYTLKVGRLKGLPTREELGKSVDNLVLEIQKHAKTRDKVLIYPWATTAYYSSNTLPFVKGRCGLDFLDLKEYEKELCEAIKSLNYGPLVIAKWKFIYSYNEGQSFELPQKEIILKSLLQKYCRLQIVKSTEDYEIYYCYPKY